MIQLGLTNRMSTKPLLKGLPKMICWFENHSRDVQSSISFVYLISSISSRSSGGYIDKENFRVPISLFASRVLTVYTWQNNADVYLTPKKD